jgi:peptidoglycan-N-acetylmuramic acid deacetylase
MFKTLNIIKITAIVLCVIILTTTPLSAKKGSWGLSFSNFDINSGVPPKGNECAEYLKQFDAYYVGDSAEKTIYLTFDAGYENGYTNGILDTLKKHDVPAGFFLVGTYIRDNPEIITRMVKDGHIVANHTMNHPDMTAISDIAAFEKELNLAEELYKSATGLDMPRYYRPPSGTYSESNMKMAQELGYKTIFWSLAYADWDNNAQPSKETAFSKLLTRIHPGAIILLHNTSKTNSLILDELIMKYKEMGYEFKSLDELI